jgi:hypothetical protein
MQKKDFLGLTDAASLHVVGADDLVRKAPRTLLYGRTAAGRIWHVYLEADGTIHRLAYDEGGAHRYPLIRFYALGEKGDCAESSHYTRYKLLYPERCDYEFCRVLLASSCHLQFADYPQATLGLMPNRYAPFAAPTLQALFAQGAQFSTCEFEMRDAGYTLGSMRRLQDGCSNASSARPAVALAWALAA